MLEGGYDIVCGWRKDRKDAFVSRRLPSTLANALISDGHRRAPARLRLLAEGLPRRDREGHEAVRRDAPVPAGDRERADVEHRRDGGQPSGPQVRAVEVRHRPHGPRRPRPADGEVPAELFDAAAADLRADRHRDGAGRRGDQRRAGGAAVGSRHVALAAWR